MASSQRTTSVDGFPQQQDGLSDPNSEGFDWNDPYRTAFHFQPRKNWMNDPIGPMEYGGIYHFFYQYNPNDPVWVPNLVWGHSTSTDLINWTQQETALTATIPSDINGCWSGSVTLIPFSMAVAAAVPECSSKSHSGLVPAILYTGLNPDNQQLQNLALPRDPSDPYLREWIKPAHNPVMAPGPRSKFNKMEFRDPSTAWQVRDGSWRVIMGSIDESSNMVMAVMFKSDDFINWVETDRPLHWTNGTILWECPDFFPVYVTPVSRSRNLGVETSIFGADVKHVLKLSMFTQEYEYYTLGKYDLEKDVYVPDKGSVETHLGGLRFDYGKFYASKSFYDGVDRRRVLWGWVNESCSKDDNRRKGWAGVQTIPRTILLDESGKELVFWPVKEVEKLRGNRVDFPMGKVLAGGGSMMEISGITAAQADVEVSFRVSSNVMEKAETLDPSWSTDPQQLCNENTMAASSAQGVGPFGLLVLVYRKWRSTWTNHYADPRGTEPLPHVYRIS